MVEFDEKRNFTRVNTDCQMTFKRVDSNQIYDATCINLSGAGILFESREDIEPGKALEISLKPENNITPTLNAFVEVVRTSRDNSGVFEVAASIRGIKGN